MRLGLREPQASAVDACLSLLCFWLVASFIVALGLPPPSRQVFPIPLIGGKVQVLSVAGWWVGVVYPVLHGPPGPFRPRFQGRDATVSIVVCVCVCVCAGMYVCIFAHHYTHTTILSTYY